MKRTLFLLVFIPILALSQGKRTIGLEIESGEPIPITVDQLSNVGTKLGLTERSISDRVEQYLKKLGVRASRTNKGIYLSVDVDVDEKTFGVIVKFRRLGSFTARNQTFEQYITSWVVYSFGSHNDRARPILDAIDENLGYFAQGFKMANPNY